MIELNEEHYAIKLLEKMLPYGVASAQFGAITATLQYPDGDVGAHTLTLVHNKTNTGLIFTILNNAFNTTIIESEIDWNGGAWYNQHRTISNSKLPNLWR